MVGAFLAHATSFAAFLFAVVVGGTVSFLVIGLAWLRYRPMIGIPLLLGVLGNLYLMVNIRAQEVTPGTM